MKKWYCIVVVLCACWLSSGVEGARYIARQKQEKASLKHELRFPLLTAEGHAVPKAPAQAKRKRIKGGNPALFCVCREQCIVYFATGKKISIPRYFFSSSFFLLDENKRGPPCVS